MPIRLPISLCTFVKNEEINIRGCIESVYPIMQEVIVVVDDATTDNTFNVAKEYTDRVYRLPFTDFGRMRTITAHLASSDWVLMLDADERILGHEWGSLAGLIDQPVGVSGNTMEFDVEGRIVIDSWALPRKRWADRRMTKREDAESWPDYQVRLFRNHKNREKIWFRRRVHETVAGCINTQSTCNVTIHHFQNVQKDEQRLAERAAMYKRLRAMDIAEGIEHDIPAVLPEDAK